MRNLNEYPVTNEELVTFLEEQLVKERKRIEAEMACGDMTLVYLKTLLDGVKEKK